QHLTNNRLNVLIVNFYALQTVNVLDFVGNVTSQRLNTLQTQNVVRVAWTVRYNFTLGNHLTFKHSQLTVFRNEHFVMGRTIVQYLTISRGNDQAALAFGFFTKAHST